MPTEPSRRLAGWAALAVATGALSAVQSRVNGALSAQWEAPLLAAVWSFGSGWALLTAVVLARPASRRGLRALREARRGQDVRSWQLLGGLLGGAYVASQTYAVPVVGVALFTIASVAGRTVNALVVDRVGWGPAGVRPVSAPRVVAAAAALAGVAVAVGGRLGGQGTALVLGPVLLALVTGAGLAAQSAINGQVRRHTGDVASATWLNFTWGTALLGALAAAAAVAGLVRPAVSGAPPAWMLVGGLIGVLTVSATVVLVHHLGVLVLILLTLSGQLLGALALDAASPVTRSLVGVQLVAGVLVTLAAAAGAGWDARPGARGTRAAARSGRSGRSGRSAGGA